MEVFIAVLIAMPVIIGLFMEVYKKTIRKDKAKTTEIYAVALILSVGTTVSGYFGFELQGLPPALFVYFMYVFTGQFFVSMELIKKVVKIIAEHRGVRIEGFKKNE